MNKGGKRGTNAKKSTRVTLGAYAEPQGMLLLANLSSALGISIIHTEFVHRGTVWSARLTSPDALKRITQRKDNKSQTASEDVFEDAAIRPDITIGSRWKQLVTSCADSGLSD